MSAGPVSHHIDALSLQNKRECDLITIALRDGLTFFRFHNGKQVTWQGGLYENVPIIIGGDEETADEKTARPTMRIFASKKVFGIHAQQGLFELAVVTRKRVLSDNLAANANIADTKIWLISRIISLSSQSMECELRSPTDGPVMMVPHRQFAPPEFPFVSI